MKLIPQAIFRSFLTALVIILCMILGCEQDKNPIAPDPHAPIFESSGEPHGTDREQPLSVTLCWSCTDPDGDKLVYDLYLGSAINPPRIATDLTEEIFQVHFLRPETSYYWRVVARDESGRETGSLLRQFITVPTPTYPLTVGNYWEYDGIFYNLNFDMERLPEYLLDTIFFNSVVVTESTDTLLDTLEVYRFRETLTEFSPGGETIFETDNYFNNRGHGFYNYAYSTPANTKVTPLKLLPGMKYRFRSQLFDSPHEILKQMKSTIITSALQSNQIVYENPPVRSLQYPFRIGVQWTSRQPGHPWRIDKLITDTVEFSVPAGNFGVYRVLWLYDIDDDGAWDEDVSIADYLSTNNGLVARNLLVTGIQVFDEMGSHLGAMDIAEEWVLTSYNVISNAYTGD